MKFKFQANPVGAFLFFAALYACVLLGSARTFGAERAKRARNFEDVYKASCRVGVEGARGSGTIIGFDSDINKYLVLTNYHVVTNSQSATCEFWAAGLRKKTTGRIIWRAHDQNQPYDFAIVAIEPDFVESNGLCYVPLAGEGVDVEEREVFDSAGCPKGSHVWAWKGAVTSVNRTDEFTPAPYPGQSGSGIFLYANGKPWYAGTLTWLVGQEGSDDAKGAFIPVDRLWRALDSKRRAANEPAWRAPDNYAEIPWKP